MCMSYYCTMYIIFRMRETVAVVRLNPNAVSGVGVVCVCVIYVHVHVYVRPCKMHNVVIKRSLRVNLREVLQTPFPFLYLYTLLYCDCDCVT